MSDTQTSHLESLLQTIKEQRDEATRSLFQIKTQLAEMGTAYLNVLTQLQVMTEEVQRLKGIK